MIRDNQYLTLVKLWYDIMEAPVYANYVRRENRIKFIQYYTKQATLPNVCINTLKRLADTLDDRVQAAEEMK